MLGLPPVLDVLYQRLLHCATDSNWSSRVAGAEAIRQLVHCPLLPSALFQVRAGWMQSRGAELKVAGAHRSRAEARVERMLCF